MRIRRAVAAALAAALATGCGALRRPEIHVFTLTPIPPAAATGASPAPAPPGAPIGLGALELPPGLDRQDIVVREDEHRLDVRGTELWSAPLGRLLLHTLAVDLAERLAPGAVVLPGQTQPAGGVRALDLVFDELAIGPRPEVVLDVRWSLAATAAGAPALVGEERVVEAIDSLDSASVAAGTSRALAALADRLAARVGAEPAPPGAGH